MMTRTGKACRVRMELVRQVGHPRGDSETGYELVLPLDPDGHIDATSWCDDVAHCSARRIRRGHPDEVGTLARTPRGRWYFDYGTGHDAENHQGIRRGDELFRRDQLITINESDGKSRTFRVMSVEPV